VVTRMIALYKYRACGLNTLPVGNVLNSRVVVDIGKDDYF